MNFQVYAGAYFQEHSHYITSTSANRDVFRIPSGAIGATFLTHLSGRWSTGVDIFGTIPESRGAGAMDYTLNFGIPLAYDLANWAQFIATLGIDSKGVFGDGGSSVQNNGGGQATFYKASTHRIGFSPALQLGFLFAGTNHFSIRTIVHIHVPLDNHRRQFSTLLAVGYVL